MSVALVGAVGSVVVVLLTRLPGLTADDRRRARIVRDAELWKVLPDDSPARAPLAKHLGDATTELLAERKRDRVLEVLWTQAWWYSLTTWVLLLVQSALPAEPAWMDQVRFAAGMAAISAGAIAITALGVASVIATLRAWKWLRPKFRRR